jgi:hypothetical protein
MLEGGQLKGFRRGRHELRIVRAHGPRRLTGGWWRQPWARDEYELLTPDGALYPSQPRPPRAALAAARGGGLMSQRDVGGASTPQRGAAGGRRRPSYEPGAPWTP